jgi:hypothetical protein
MDAPKGQVTKCGKGLEIGLGGSQGLPRSGRPCEC